MCTKSRGEKSTCMMIPFAIKISSIHNYQQLIHSTSHLLALPCHVSAYTCKLYKSTIAQEPDGEATPYKRTDTATNGPAGLHPRSSSTSRFRIHLQRHLSQTNQMVCVRCAQGKGSHTRNKTLDPALSAHINTGQQPPILRKNGCRMI